MGDEREGLPREKTMRVVQVEDGSSYTDKQIKLKNALNDALDAIVWMSGSPSFGPEGEAHEGWVKVRDKMDVWFKVASGG